MHLCNSLLPLVSRISEIFIWVHFIWKSIIIASLRKCFCKQVRRNIGWSFEIWELFPMATKLEETSSPRQARRQLLLCSHWTFLRCHLVMAVSYLIIYQSSPPDWNLLEGRPAFHFRSPRLLIQVNSIHKWMNKKKIKDNWNLYELTRSRSLVNIVQQK